MDGSIQSRLILAVQLLNSDGNDYVNGGTHDDAVYGGAGDDKVVGGSGNDQVSGDDGDDILLGRHGDDVLFGGNGNDTIKGGYGEDQLEGGAGNDIISGGAGSDTFIFKKSFDHDRIKDFDGNSPSHDQIDLSEFGFENFLDMRGSVDIAQFGKSTVLYFDEENTITLLKTSLQELDDDYFVYNNLMVA